MDVLTALTERRTIRSYDPAHVMPDTDIHRLLDAAMLSPTSYNLQHWRFVAVTDPIIKQQLRAAAWDQAQVTDASVVIVVCADIKAWEKNPARYHSGAPESVQKIILPMIDQFYRGKDQLQRDEAMRSCGMAAQTIMLMAKEMNYDSVPMIGFNAAQVAHIIRLPHDHVIGLMIAIGKRTVDAPPRSGRLAYADVVFSNGFPA